MSYEGYEQCICANGHYFTVNALSVVDYNPKCYSCNAKAVWTNSVDQTQGDEYGYIPQECFIIDIDGKYIIPTNTADLRTYLNHQDYTYWFCCNHKPVTIHPVDKPCTYGQEICNGHGQHSLPLSNPFENKCS